MPMVPSPLTVHRAGDCRANQVEFRGHDVKQHCSSVQRHQRPICLEVFGCQFGSRRYVPEEDGIRGASGATHVGGLERDVLIFKCITFKFHLSMDVSLTTTHALQTQVEAPFLFPDQNEHTRNPKKARISTLVMAVLNSRPTDPTPPHSIPSNKGQGVSPTPTPIGHIVTVNRIPSDYNSRIARCPYSTSYRP